MSKLSISERKGASNSPDLVRAGGGSGIAPASSPPPVPPPPPSASGASGGYTVPPPPPPAAIDRLTPTPTSLSGGGAGRGADGLGILGGILFKVIMVVLANGIGFGVWWYTQGGFSGYGMGEEETAYESEWADAPVEAETEGADMERLRVEAMFRAADSVQWPLVVLSGMVAGATPEKTSAILNGTLVSQYQFIEGIELISVDQDGVVLEFRNTRKYIRIGEGT